MAILRKGQDPREAAAADQEGLDVAVAHVSDGARDAVRALVAEAARIAQEQPSEPYQVDALVGVWTRLVETHVAPAVTQAWSESLTASAEQEERRREHLATVVNRLSSGALPTITEEVAETWREVLALANLLGWSGRRVREELAASFLWHPDLSDRRARLRAADADVDAIVTRAGYETRRAWVEAMGGLETLPDAAQEAIGHRDRLATQVSRHEQALAAPSGRYDSQWERRADRIARTEGAASYNAAQQAQALDEGVQCKSWLATYDGRTRGTHLEVDGTVVPVGQPFTVGGALLMHPGDPSGPPGESVNCRCTMLYGDCEDLAQANRELADDLERDRLVQNDAQATEPTPSEVVDEVTSEGGRPTPARFDPDRGAAPVTAGADVPSSETEEPPMRRLKHLLRTQHGLAQHVREHFLDDDGNEVARDKATRLVRTWYSVERQWLGEDVSRRKPGDTVKPAEQVYAMVAADEPEEGAATVHWEGPITMEGLATTTGDRRAAEDGAWRWDSPVGPMLWSKEGTHDNTQSVGLILEAERQDGGVIFARGSFDFDNPDAVEAARRVDNGTQAGVSIEPDEVTVEWRVAAEVYDRMRTEEEAWLEGEADDLPEPERDADGNVIVFKFDPNDEVEVVLDAQVRAAALVHMPAYKAAKIGLTTAGKQALEAARGALVAAAVADLAADQWVSWDDGAMVGQVTAVDVDGATVTVQQFVEADEDGDDWEQVGDPVSLPADDVVIIPDPTEADDVDEDGIVAAAIAAPVDPPSAWFRRPEADEPTPLTVQDDGQVFGHIAAYDTCHTSYQDSCVRPPKSACDYAAFHLGSIRTEEGEDVAVGRITMDTGHANPRANMRAATSHYDHTGTVAADVRAVDGKHGVWVSGALRPGLSEEQVRTFRSSPPSGDWRPRGGNLELVAVLSVNVPGFPIPRKKALVAGGYVQSLVAAGMVVRRDDTQGESLTASDRRYLKSLANRERRRHALATQRRVHGGAKALAANLASRVHPDA